MSAKVQTGDRVSDRSREHLYLPPPPNIVFCPLSFDKVQHLLVPFDKPMGFEEVLSHGRARRDCGRGRGRQLEETAA